jgi:hypothetical protein
MEAIGLGQGRQRNPKSDIASPFRYIQKILTFNGGKAPRYEFVMPIGDSDLAHRVVLTDCPAYDVGALETIEMTSDSAGVHGSILV